MDHSESKLDPSISQALGARIRQLRQAGPAKLTQEDLAEQASISMSFLSLIERGERVPRIETLMRIAVALGVSLGELLSFAERQEEPQALDPILLPLAEYVRSHSLTRRDIDRLLGVAKVMFDPPAVVAAPRDQSSPEHRSLDQAGDEQYSDLQPPGDPPKNNGEL